MKRNKKTKNTIYIKISSVLIFSLISGLFCYINSPFYTYAKLYENKSVEKPTAEDNDSKSVATIVDPHKYEILSPLNPTPSTVRDTAEYKFADTYVISLETLPYRVEYFSPTYLYALNTAKNRVRSNLYAAGGGNDTMSAIRDTVREFPSEIRQLNSQYRTLDKQLKELERAGAGSDDPRVINIETAMSQIETGIATMRATEGSLSMAVSGYNKVNNLVNNIDKNMQIFNIKNMLTKSMITAYLSYLQLDYYEQILTKQTELYDNIYKLYKKNYELGLATLLEVDQNKINYQNAKKNLSSTRATKKNVKQLIADNLGYKFQDVDKLEFAPPTIDLDYVDNVVPANDYSRAYYNNSTYESIRSAGESNKRLPESSGRHFYERRLEDTQNKIIAAIDVLYAKMMSSKIKYESLSYQKEMLNMNVAAADRKYNNELVSQNEYLGLKIQNLATEMNIKTIEYNFVTDIYNYYYGTYGIVDIN